MINVPMIRMIAESRRLNGSKICRSITQKSMCNGLKVLCERNLRTGQEATYKYGASGRIAKNVIELTDYYHTDYSGIYSVSD
jgi:hypothetical protein